MNDFLQLDLDHKAALLWTDGSQLATVVQNDKSFTLYRLNNFYVEVVIDISLETILDIVPFTEGWMLDKYLEFIQTGEI